MRDWLTKNKRFLLIASMTLSSLLLLAFVLLMASDKTPSGSASATDSSAQVSYATTSIGFHEVTEPAEGKMPVSILSSTDYLNYVKNTSDTVTEAGINPGTNITAAVFTAGKDARILSARLLPEQFQEALDSYELRKASVTIGATPGSRVVQSSPFGPPRVVSTGTESPVDSGGPPWGVIIIITMVAGAMIAFILMRNRARKAGTNNMTKNVNGAEPPETRFTDIAGCDEAVEEMQEVVMFLKDPKRFEKVGARPPTGALFVGPAGTGKTLLARAVAGEAGVPFYSVAGSDFVEMYVGVGAKRVREVFKKAKQHPEGAILFIDEIDAVGRKRGSGSNNGSQEHDNTVNALLVEMDGFEANNVVVIGATNRDDILDEALVRPGRLERKIVVGLPDRIGRGKILEVHSRNKPLDGSVDLDLMARRTPGMSGAELSQLVNEACMEAGRNERDCVTMEDFDSALAIVAMGRARLSAIVTEHDRLVTAWHEAGHTVVAMMLPEADRPVSVSIIPRGPAGGVTWMAQGDDLFLTRKRALARIAVAMGGRAAEEMLLEGEFTSGPYGDLTSATNMAFAMVTQYGMTGTGLMIRSEGLLSTGSKITDDTVDAVEELLADALDVARSMLSGHRELFDRIVSALLEYDTLSLVQLEELRGDAESFAPQLPPAPVDYHKRAPELVHAPAPVPVHSPMPAPVSEPARAPRPKAKSSGWGIPLRKKRLAEAIKVLRGKKERT